MNVITFILLLMPILLIGCLDFVSGSLSVKNFNFASDIDGLGDYVLHTRNYTSGEQVFMYFEVHGFQKRSDDSAQIFQTLTVITPEGIPLVIDGESIENYIMIDQSLDATGMDIIWFDNHLPAVDVSWIAGRYDVEIVIEDRVANEDVSYTTFFNIL